MLSFYGSFRQEIGSIMIGLGIAAVILGVAELLANLLNEWLSGGQAWLLIGGGAFVALLGFWLNITRSRRRVDIKVPPRDAATGQPPQHTH